MYIYICLIDLDIEFLGLMGSPCSIKAPRVRIHVNIYILGLYIGIYIYTYIYIYI